MSTHLWQIAFVHIDEKAALLDPRIFRICPISQKAYNYNVNKRKTLSRYIAVIIGQHTRVAKSS
jgi:hypothetical protein